MVFFGGGAGQLLGSRDPGHRLVALEPSINDIKVRGDIIRSIGEYVALASHSARQVARPSGGLDNGARAALSLWLRSPWRSPLISTVKLLAMRLMR